MHHVSENADPRVLANAACSKSFKSLRSSTYGKEGTRSTRSTRANNASSVCWLNPHVHKNHSTNGVLLESIRASRKIQTTPIIYGCNVGWGTNSNRDGGWHIYRQHGVDFFWLDAAWLNEGRCRGGRPSVS